MDSRKAGSEQHIVAGTMNLKNLVKAGVPFYNHPPYSERDFERKAAWTAGMLTTMGAELIGFQEVFHEEALLNVVRRAPHLKNAEVIVKGENGTLPVVGLASNYPVVECKSIAKIPKTALVSLPCEAVVATDFSRPILHAVVKVGAIEVDAWVAHLKSKRPDLKQGETRHDPFASAVGSCRSLVQRGTEAVGLRHLLVANRRKTKRPAVLLADMNDDPRSETTRIVTGTDPWKRLPLKQKLREWSFRMWDAVELFQRRIHDIGWFHTHVFNGYYERLDGIFVSNDFHPDCPAPIGRVEEVRVFNDHLRDETASNATLPAWESDHGHLTAELVFT